VPHGVTSIEKRLPQGIDRPCGENAAKLKSSTEKKIRLREVSAYSTVFPEQPSGNG
jgi:hypothetical protein